MESSFTDSHIDIRTDEGYTLNDSDYGLRSSYNNSTFVFENENRPWPCATPFTQITEKTCKPDLAIYCPKCDEYIDVKVLMEHRTFHRALQIFCYNFSTIPSSVNKLTLRRNTLIKKLNRENFRDLQKVKDDISDSKLDKLTGLKVSIKEINKLYEFLKSLIEDSYEETRQVVDEFDTNVTSRLLTSNSCKAVQIVAMCTSQNKRWKKSMEDRHVYEDSYGESRDSIGRVFMGVYDGHHGDYTAELLAKEFHRLLLVEMNKFDTLITTPKVDTMKSYSLNCPPRPHTTGSQRRMLYTHSVDVIESIRLHCEEKFERFLGLKSREQSEICLRRYNTTLDDVSDRRMSTMVRDDINDRGINDDSWGNSRKSRSKLNDGFNINTKSSTNNNSLSKSATKSKINLTSSMDLSDNLLKDEILRVSSVKERKMKESGVPNTKLMYSKNMADAFNRVYHLIDILLEYGKDESSKIRWSGASAATVVIEDISRVDGDGYDQAVRLAERQETGEVIRRGPQALLHLANAGNVHAMLIDNNCPKMLTTDHTCNNRREKKRVQVHGGTLSMSDIDCRVNGILATTRGLGNHGDLALKRCVIPDPYTTTIPLTDTSQILVIASHGLWEVFSHDEVSAILLKILPCNQVPLPERIHSSVRDLLTCKSRQLSSASSKFTKKGQNSNRPVKINKTSRTTETSNTTIHNIFGQYQEKSDIIQDTFQFHRDDLVNSFKYQENSVDGGRYGDDRMAKLARRESMMTDITMSHDTRRDHVATWMAEDLVQAALLGGAKDNITVMVVVLAGCDI